VESSIDWLKAEDQLVFYLEYFRDTMFPQEWTPPPPRTHEEKVHMQEYAQEKLQVIVGNAVASIGLIGNRNAVRGADALFSALQSTHANKHLIYSILEKLMEHVLPEITPRNLSQNLVVLNAN
jgi:sorting nexin-25